MTIKERAHYAEKEWLLSDDVTRYGYEQGYVKGATDQQKIDKEKACSLAAEIFSRPAMKNFDQALDDFKQAMEK